MGMIAVLCALSPKRRAMIEDEPQLLRELLAARHEGPVPGLVDLDKTWDALDRIVCRRVEGTPLADAIVARSGQKMRARASLGTARLLEPPRVMEIAKALDGLPGDLVAKRYDELFGKEVHGGFGQERAAPGDSKWLRDKAADARAKEIALLHESLTAVRELYAEAAKAAHAMMSIVT